MEQNLNFYIKNKEKSKSGLVLQKLNANHVYISWKKWLVVIFVHVCLTVNFYEEQNIKYPVYLVSENLAFALIKMHKYAV